MSLDYDLQKTLEWCAANDVVFQVTNETGKVAITARRGPIFAEYLIDEPFDAGQLGNATWATLFSVKHGSQFHERFGSYPPVGSGVAPAAEGSGEAGVANGARPNGDSAEVNDAAPNLSTPSTPRRDSVGGGG